MAEVPRVPTVVPMVSYEYVAAAAERPGRRVIGGCSPSGSTARSI